MFQGFMHLLRLDEICSLKSDPFDSQRDWLTAELFDFFYQSNSDIF